MEKKVHLVGRVSLGQATGKCHNFGGSGIIYMCLVVPVGMIVGYAFGSVPSLERYRHNLCVQQSRVKAPLRTMFNGGNNCGQRMLWGLLP